MTTRKIPHNPVAANTLFHFTSSIDNIENILKKEFLPKYCIEDWATIDHNLPNAILPMVCFCDIPLSQIRNHISKYGNKEGGGYGIGLKKEWGTPKGITPVLYIHPESATLEHLSLLINNAHQNPPFWNKLNEEQSHVKTKNLLVNVLEFITQSLSMNASLMTAIIMSIMYFKPCKGKMWDKQSKNFLPTMHDFYEEREWRYIPLFEQDDYNKAKITYEDYMNKEIRDINEEQLEKYKLSFEPNDIKYIIVNKESEIPDMIQKIKDIKSPKYENRDIELLITRIISIEHILADF